MKRKFQLLRSIEALLWSVAIGIVCFYVSQYFLIHTLTSLVIAVAVALGVAVAGGRKLQIFTIREKDLAIYINHKYPQLEESADLLLERDETLTLLQQLQKAKTIQRFETIYRTINLPHHIGQAVGVLLLSALIGIALTAFSNKDEKTSPAPGRAERVDSIAKKFLPAFIKNALVTISPPGYTGEKKFASRDFNLTMPENSTVLWKIIFDGEVINVSFIFSGKDTVKVTPKAPREFQITRSFKESGFYQIAWTTADSSAHYSDFYKIETLKDEPPTIAIENLNQFVELKLTDNLKVELKSTLTDDYGLSRGYIIGTVSKGSGEAIKFREEKLAFDRPEKIRGKKIQASKTIDLLKLGLQPGDELYFYIEAFDIKTPNANRTRTETYFISLQDTSSQIITVDASLGVDLMPEYFRSQRQIIIDSEKLLRAKKTITKQNFNARSNELGYDQKVLRLRYGEFLGEEFDSGIGPHHEIPDTEKNEDVIKKFGHSHDTENEHNLVDEKASKNILEHDHADPTKSSEQKDPLKEFVHAHDGDEEATFFIQSIKAKLKAAVTIMWDAELYLRLYQPEKSLPYQYKALKLLKEISQDSRIYVHRTGFDSPPLKEEKRLTGDLSEIKSSTIKNQNAKRDVYPDIRNALLTIEALLQKDSIVLTSEIKNIFTKAGQELATLALKQPGRYLQSLSLLKKLIHDETKAEERLNALISLRSEFWKVLPQETMSPQGKSAITHDLDVRFLESLDASNLNN
jgi:hypothetical protein